MASRMSRSDLRVVLVGQERVGKSSAGNTILGAKVFDSRFSSVPVTLSCMKMEGEVLGHRVSVVDTPGLFSTELSADQVKEKLLEAVQMSSPGPHVFLLTLQLGRFTPQEQKGMETLQKMLSPDVSKHTMVLFTYGDRLEDTDIKEFIREDTNLQKLLKICSGLYHVFNNKKMEYREQVQHLLDKIDNISQGGNMIYQRQAQLERPFSNSKSLRVVLVGQERVGKSSAGNTILGAKVFDSRFSSVPVTLSCMKMEGEVLGHRVSVVDTPGLFSTELSADQVKEKLLEAVQMSSPGPHVFLLTLQLGRFTPQEQKGMETLQKMLSPDVSKHTMVLFTYGDRLEDTDIKEFIREDTNLQKLLKSCSGLYHVFNNKKMEDREQVQHLLDKIDNISQGGNMIYQRQAQSEWSFSNFFSKPFWKK